MRLDNPDRGSLVREMFNRICSRYDLNNRVLSLGLDRYWRWRAVRLLGLRRGDSVVDICCGTGDLCKALHKVVSPGQVVGVDFADEMLAIARTKFPEFHYVEADALAVPLEGGFKAATIAFGPRNIPDLNGLWTEMKRLVVPGGQVLSLELTRPKGLLGKLHSFYLGVVVPRLGGWLSGDPDAYAYLSKTIAGFISSEALVESMQAAGLVVVRAIPLCGGIVTVHIGKRPDVTDSGA
ncbi:MAG: ubiquinone/menaquinone biosynthesis methyltransferase [Candidatus Eremiobacteraeota bacterium]|nr:ubiquinone/menaquinone biosynthesis methyltransferase [Candidatus Eremiobacteraeota bacterium]